MKRFTPHEDDFIRFNYLQMSLNEMGDALGRSFGSVAGRMKLLGLTVPASIIAERNIKSYQKLLESGKVTRYSKGHTPANKGKKLPAEMVEKLKPTMFKPGNMPHNYVHNGEPYLYVRKPANGYEKKLWWIQEGTNKRSAYLAYLCRQNGIDLNGKKPRLKPGFNHQQPPTINDIIVVTDAENMELNTVQRYPEELVQLIRIKSKLSRQINKIKTNE